MGGLGYWRYAATNKSLATPAVQQDLGLVEVPKTLPDATLEDRVKALEDVNSKLVTQINGLKTSNSGGPSVSSLDSRLTAVEGATTDLKVRISALEKASPSSTSVSSQPTIYIPMGSTAGPWSNTDWSTLNEYEISLDPGNYPGYTGMNLEVNFRLVDPAGTGSVRLYNVTDSSVVSSQLDTSSTSFGLKTSVTFKLASGQKTYKLQVKSTGGKDLYIQSARIRANF